MRPLTASALAIALAACRSPTTPPADASPQSPSSATAPASLAATPEAGPLQSSSAAGSNPFHAGDRWVGSLCGSALPAPTLVIREVTGNAIDARFDFRAGCVDGSFAVTGAFEPATSRVTFRPGAWINRPDPDSRAVGLVGTIDAASRTYSGTITSPGCSEFPSAGARVQVRSFGAAVESMDSFKLVQTRDAGGALSSPPSATPVDVLDLAIDDFGCRSGDATFNSWRAIAHPSPATGAAKKILDQIVRHRFPRNADECLNGSPRIFDAAKGSFSAPGASEVLYLSDEGDCSSGPHCENWGTMTVSLFEGESLLAFGVIEASSWIDAVVDVDGDGRDEIVIASAFSNMGSGVEWARVVRMGRDGLAVLEDFGTVAEWTYGAGPGGAPEDLATRSYAVAHARRAWGAPIQYRLESKTGPCPDAGTP